MIKAYVVRLFAIALALAGVVALAYFAALFAWPQVVPAVPALPAGATPFLAAAGAVIAALAVLVSARQSAFIRAEKRRREDRLRRVRVYRSDEALQQAHDSRLEPFIGPDSVAERQADRRVA